MPMNTVLETGSSPRVRGAGDLYWKDIESGGIIPARAGSSILKISVTDACRDHPRACGEQHSLAYIDRTDVGSSPRVRGAELLGELCHD